MFPTVRRTSSPEFKVNQGRFLSGVKFFCENHEMRRVVNP